MNSDGTLADVDFGFELGLQRDETTGNPTFFLLRRVVDGASFLVGLGVQAFQNAGAGELGFSITDASGVWICDVAADVTSGTCAGPDEETLEW